MIPTLWLSIVSTVPFETRFPASLPPGVDPFSLGPPRSFFAVKYLLFMKCTSDPPNLFCCWIFLAALAALYLPCVPESVSATLEFRHKEWLLRLETLSTFDRGDGLRKKRLKKIVGKSWKKVGKSQVWILKSLRRRRPRVGIELPGQLKRRITKIVSS